MTSRAIFWKWSAVGAFVAALLLWGQMGAVGGSAGLLEVGDASTLRPLIESQLGFVPGDPGYGHDGQIYYAIALDLDGDLVAPLLDHGGYRYRRILYPLLASGFGAFEGRVLLYGMIAVTIASATLATGAAAALGRVVGLTEWAALAVVLNPGVWLSVRLLTADTLALALMLLGLLAMAGRKSGASIAFALSVLAKDVYLITPAGLVVSRDRRRWWQPALPILVLVAWMTWVTIIIGDGFTGRGNLDLPFAGIAKAASTWLAFDSAEWIYLVFALLTVFAGLWIGVMRRSWLRWPILGWSILGLISSNWVWDFGNNAARAFAPLAVLIVLGFGSQVGLSVRTGATTTLEPGAR